MELFEIYPKPSSIKTRNLETIEDNLSEISETDSEATSSPFIFPNYSIEDFISKFKWHFSSVEQTFNAILDLLDLTKKIKDKYSLSAIHFNDVQIIENKNQGVSGSYIIIDDLGNKKFIVKPLDEDVGCIQSRFWPTHSIKNPIREDITLYQSSLREALAYRIALLAGIESIIPKTELAIIRSNEFNHIVDKIDTDKYKNHLNQFENYDREKICSVQEFVPNAIDLFSALHSFQDDGLSDAEIETRFDQSDFEEVNLLIWLSNDTDAHAGNILVYVKGVDEVGNEILGFKKIDNGLAFPEKNRNLRNHLAYLPNANRPISQTLREKIFAIDENLMIEQFMEMGLEDAVSAFKSRISYLKKLAEDPLLTIKQINNAIAEMGEMR